MTSWFKKICSYFLIFVMFFNLLPLQTLAASSHTSSTSNVDENSETAEVPVASDEESRLIEESTILMEIVEKRTEYSKEYKLSNGLNLAVVYPEPVHYKEDGCWKDIDNTLQAKGSGDSITYATTAGSWCVGFPQQIYEGAQITITKDGYDVSFGMAGELRSYSATGSATATYNTHNSQGGVHTMSISGARQSRGEIHEYDYSKMKEDAQYPELIRDKLKSRMSYTDVYNNTDIIYDVSSYQLKESIVINAYDASVYGYLYTLKTGTLVPVLKEDGSIDLLEPDSNEVIMSMPAPFMIDDAGAISNDVLVTLEQKDSGYLLAYQMPMDWLAEEERVWPVVLDPVVEPGTSTSNILDHFVAQYYSASNTNGALLVGYNADYGKMRSYIKFSAIPELTASDVIVNATLRLDYLGGSSGTTVIEAHKVTGDWATSTITWDNQPTWETTIQEYCSVGSASEYSWDITDIARDWYSDGNTGVMLKGTDSIESGSTDNWKKFYSVDYDKYSPEIWPYLEITYQTVIGIESYWDYTTSSAGRAGTGYVNNFTGNLTWVHSDLGFDGNLMPVSISHIYNVNENSSNEHGLGYGWRTNYHQTIELSESGDYYIWTDADGTQHDFVLGDDANTYVDEDGLLLTLTVSSSSFTLTDKYGNTSKFDSYGRLISMVNNQSTKSQVTITYSGTSNRITQITDGVGRLYKFTYNSSNLLTKIGYHGSNGASGTEITNVQFAYSSSKLITITYKDSLDSHFSYSGYYLISATDIDGYKVAFTYSSGTAKRVASIKEYDGTTAGNEIFIEYARNKVKISDNDHTQISYYNDFGNLISTQDDLGNAEFNQYAANEYSEKPDYGNQLTLVSKRQNTVVNLLYHSSFESGSAWYATSTSSYTRTTSKSYMGSYSLQVTLSSSASAISAYGAAITVPANETCTFSAYVQSVTASVQLGLGTTSSAYIKSETQSAGSEWKRLEVSYTNNSSASITLRPLLILSTGGIAYVDCVQVELSSGASRYNLIQNGDFRTTGYWSSSTGRTTLSDSAAPQLNATAYKMTGNPTSAQSIYQTIAVSGSTGDAFVLSGWAKGNSVPLSNSARQFCLKITFNHTDGSTNTGIVNFNSAYDASGDWQYAAGRVAATEAYSSVKVELVYNYNANDVYFDGIQLFKEELGERYTYYQDGNLATVTDVLGLKTTYYYSNNDPIKIVEASGLTTQNTYSNHNVTRSVQSYTHEGSTVNLASYSYTYDAYGNQLRTYSEIDGVVKQTYTSYSSDKNHIATTTDELGNVTTYEYDLQTSVLLSVKYPEDTDATKTEYEYDEMYRLVSTTATTDQSKTMSATYTYNEDLLTKIATGSTVYNFTYGDFSQRTKVAVGSTTLASYTYTDDVYRRLETIDYGNLDAVEYTYDDLGRVIKETYYENGSTTVSRTITYEYDNTGALATMVDSKTGVTTKYYYDTIGRNTGVYESGGSSTHRIKYTYDELGRLQKSAETCGSSTYTTEYSYYGNGQIYQIEAGSSTELYTYDVYERLDKWYTYHGSSSNYLILKNIHYEQPDDRSTSSWPSVWTYTSTGGYSVNYNYGYDANGNIVSEKVGSYTTTYVYDSANQLIRENNQKAGKTWIWTYDDAGNILTKKEYAYTTGTLGSVVDTITYTYGNANWGDLLTKYDGVTISYDSIGNPLSDGTWTYTWQQGRNLATMSNGSTTWTYTYDANGMRTKRTTGSTTYTYTYNGSQLTHMTYGSTALHFYYDASGSPLSVTYGGATYYYVLNLQGDVVAILNSSGVQVVGYTYDAWGRPLSTTGSMSSTLGLYNPLRYRGYVYDRETGLYYLQSRYYNPTWGRFINADSQLNPDDGIFGYNMFAYCQNNPVMYSDPSGHSFTLACIVIGAIIGAAIGGGAGAYISYEQTGEVNGWAVAAGAVAGGVVGGLAGWGVGAAFTAAGAAGAGTASGTIAQAGQAIYNNWQSAEAGLRQAVNSVSDYGSRILSTPLGNRVVDAYNTSTGLIAEAKYGYQAYSSFIQSEVARDAWLLQSGTVSEVQWHFYYSQVSQTIGGSYQLIHALLEAGIQVFYH